MQNAFVKNNLVYRYLLKRYIFILLNKIQKLMAVLNLFDSAECKMRCKRLFIGLKSKI